MRTRLEIRIVAQSLVAAMRQHLRALRICNLSEDGKTISDDEMDATLYDMRALVIRLAAHLADQDEQDLARYQSYAQNTTGGNDDPAS